LTCLFRGSRIPSMSLESSQSSSHRRSGQRRRLINDPVAVRALAHPVRLELLSIVGLLGQITTADAARGLGISHGLASHHLRQLAKYGFVIQVDGKDNREHPWRLVSTSHSWDNVETTREGAAAADVLEEVWAEQALAHFLDWLRQRNDWPLGWRQHTGIGQSTVYLTLPELAQLEGAIDALILGYVEERPIDDVSCRPEGSVPVEITHLVVPRSGPPSSD
jgi:DNA-binding transcriptional ArsR family regulator